MNTNVATQPTLYQSIECLKVILATFTLGMWNPLKTMLRIISKVNMVKFCLVTVNGTYALLNMPT